VHIVHVATTVSTLLVPGGIVSAEPGMNDTVFPLACVHREALLMSGRDSSRPIDVTGILDRVQ
jgi:hypothetical protein